VPNMEPDLVGFTLTAFGIALGLIGFGSALLQRHRRLGIFIALSGVIVWFGAIFLLPLESTHGTLFNIYGVRLGIFPELF